ncbi:MAG: hypothetical protein ABR986_00305 [Methanomassiliicoccales archaeon]
MELSTMEQTEYASIGISHETPYADRSDRSVRTYVPPIDALIGGLKPRTMTLIDSADRIVFGMVNMMSVNAVSENHDEVIWVDGGNSANPFELTTVCKRFRLSSDEVLSSVTISRAFTAYQMSTLIEDMLEKEVKRIRTGMVVISCFPDLFQDKDMEWSESFQLMRRSMDKLRELTEKHDLVTVITNFGLAKMFYRKGLRPLLYDGVDRVVRIETYGKALRIMLPKENVGTLYRPVPRNQTTLDEFRGW